MSYIGEGHKAGCRHERLNGHKPSGYYRPDACPDCGDLFIIKETEVVGDTTKRPKPYWATLLVPSNEYGWTCGDELCFTG